MFERKWGPLLTPKILTFWNQNMSPSSLPLKEKADRFEQHMCKEGKATTPPPVVYFSDKYIFLHLLFPKLFLTFYCMFELQGQTKCRRSPLRRSTLSLNKHVCTTHRGWDPEQDILDLEKSPFPPLLVLPSTKNSFSFSLTFAPLPACQQFSGMFSAERLQKGSEKKPLK